MSRFLGRRREQSIGAALLAAAPFLVLMPLGAIWLWERQGFLGWILAAAIAFLCAGLLFSAARRPPKRAAPDRSASGEAAGPHAPADEEWSANDKVAWQRVLAFAETVSGEMLSDRERANATLRAVIEEVARHYRPGEKQPMLHFTIPEALLLTERVSRRTRQTILEAVPGSRRLRVGHILWLNDARRTALALAETGGGLWQMALWVINPLQAIASEARRQLQGFATTGLTSFVADRIAQILVEEVGREAINLYSGRLQADIGELGEDRLAPAAKPPPPPRIVLAGRVNAGKSSLLNALKGDVSAAVDILPATDRAASYAFAGGDGRPALEIVDSVGLDRAERMDALINLAAGADLLVWVCAATNAARDLDRRMLDALRARFETDPALDMPPLVVVMSHIDRLRPFGEWSPPYDVEAAEGRKAAAIRGAMEALAEDLGVRVDSIVPARLDAGQTYNIDAIWAALVARLPDARRGQLLRILRLGAGSGGYSEIGRQILGAGRLVAGTLMRPRG